MVRIPGVERGGFLTSQGGVKRGEAGGVARRPSLVRRAKPEF